VVGGIERRSVGGCDVSFRVLQMATDGMKASGAEFGSADE
jgi:hypothetical protein